MHNISTICPRVRKVLQVVSNWVLGTFPTPVGYNKEPAPCAFHTHTCTYLNFMLDCMYSHVLGLKVTGNAGVPIWVVGTNCVESRVTAAGVPIWVTGDKSVEGKVCIWITGNYPV